MKNNGMTASTAVPMSIASTSSVGSRLMSSAPSGGAKMLMIPCSVWFIPAMRARCLSGTISEVEEVMAG
jgi:hypothetical protein